jgi:hypothetical protein
VVGDTLRLDKLVRRRGESLCNPQLPNLDLLPRQIAEGREFCSACVDLMERVRVKRPVNLPPSSGLTAAVLIRDLRKQRDASKPRRRFRPPAAP